MEGKIVWSFLASRDYPYRDHASRAGGLSHITRFIQVRDYLGFYDHLAFEILYPHDGRPAEAP